MDEHAEHAHAKGAMPAGQGKHTPAQAGQDKHGAHDHHAHMVADFRQRFWISLALTVPILALSSGLWEMLGLAAPVTFRGDACVLFGFFSIVFFYGDWPFLLMSASTVIVAINANLLGRGGMPATGHAEGRS